MDRSHITYNFSGRTYVPTVAAYSDYHPSYGRTDSAQLHHGSGHLPVVDHRLVTNPGTATYCLPPNTTQLGRQQTYNISQANQYQPAKPIYNYGNIAPIYSNAPSALLPHENYLRNVPDNTIQPSRQDFYHGSQAASYASADSIKHHRNVAQAYPINPSVHASHQHRQRYEPYNITQSSCQQVYNGSQATSYLPAGFRYDYGNTASTYPTSLPLGPWHEKYLQHGRIDYSNQMTINQPGVQHLPYSHPPPTVPFVETHSMENPSGRIAPDGELPISTYGYGQHERPKHAHASRTTIKNPYLSDYGNSVSANQEQKDRCTNESFTSVENEACSPALDHKIPLKTSSLRSTPPSPKSGPKPPNYCNNYHLKGVCLYGDSCIYRHGRVLTGALREELIRIAKNTPCERGFPCRDRKCWAGHVCPKPFCNDRMCKFFEHRETVVKSRSPASVESEHSSGILEREDRRSWAAVRELDTAELEENAHGQHVPRKRSSRKRSRARSRSSTQSWIADRLSSELQRPKWVDGKRNRRGKHLDR